MQTTTKTNNVFLNAENAAIVVTVNNTVVATDVQTADALVQVFLTHNINVLTDTIMCSSSIDFAEEEGFASDASAHNIIDAALEALAQHCYTKVQQALYKNSACIMLQSVLQCTHNKNAQRANNAKNLKSYYILLS